MQLTNAIQIRTFVWIVTLILIAAPAFASNMGNGPAAIMVWGIGSFFSLMAGIFFGLGNDAGKDFNWSTFLTTVLSGCVFTFFLGCAAIFT